MTVKQATVLASGKSWGRSMTPNELDLELDSPADETPFFD